MSGLATSIADRWREVRRLGPVEWTLRGVAKKTRGALNAWKRRRIRQLGPDAIHTVDVWGQTYKMTFLGQRITDPIVERIEGRREPETVACYLSLIQPGANVVELGSCYGEFTVLLSRAVGPSGHVLAVEGVPRALEILNENLRLNGCGNVRVEHAFVGMDPQDNPVDPTLPHCSIRDVLEESKLVPPALDVMVMDIEGSEANIIRDLVAWNRFRECARKPVLLWEVHAQCYPPGVSEKSLVELLQGVGYECRRVAGNRLCIPANGLQSDMA